MELSIRTEEIKKAELEMIEEFCDRHTSTLIRKSPEEIIAKFLDWQYQRYKVRKEEDGFFIFDFESVPIEPVAFISHNDPNAYQDAYNLCDRMNEYQDFDILDLLHSKKEEDEWKFYWFVVNQVLEKAQ